MCVPLLQSTRALNCCRICLDEVGRQPSSCGGLATYSASPLIGQVLDPLDTEQSYVGDSMTGLDDCSRHGRDRHTWSPGEKVPSRDSYTIPSDRGILKDRQTPPGMESYGACLDRVMVRFQQVMSTLRPEMKRELGGI